VAGKIEELFSFDFEDLIWETSLDKDTGLLLIQTRSEEKHETQFSVVNLSTGDWMIRNRRFDESWWIGISTLVGERALLHVYDDDQNPEQKSLLLWDIKRDEILAFYHNASLSKRLLGGFLMSQEEVQYEVDWEGKTTSRLPEIKSHHQDNTMLHYPFQYHPEEEEFDTIKTFITQNINVSPEAGVEYMETDHNVIISYYIREDKMLSNFLLIIDLDGRILLNQKINTSASGIGRDTFFIFERKLVFITNNSSLYVYAI
jgi:hypothetical protein